jgi:predicted ribosome quality control (RQC) complex YloA/Tae2 family protein
MVVELHERLVGARLDQVYGVGRDHLAIALGLPGSPRLWFSAEPELPHLYERPGSHMTPQRPPPFAMAARKLLSGRRIESIACIGGDRVVELCCGGDGAPRLILEVIPRRATGFVVDAGGGVRAVWRPRRGRPGLGVPYAPPGGDARPAVSSLGGAEWKALAEAADADALVRGLLHGVAGMSPLLAREIAARQEAGAALQQATEEELRRSAEAPTAARVYSPTPLEELAEPPAAGRFVLAPYGLRHLEAAGTELQATRFGSLVDAASAYYPLRAELVARAAARRDLGLDLEIAAVKLRRTLEAVASDLESAGTAEMHRRWGDLLLAHPEAPRHHGSVEVPDDYGDGAPIRIPVDPARTQVDNAQRYYGRARRAERSRQRTAERRQRLTARIDKLEGLRERVAVAAGSGDLRRLAREAQRLRVDLRVTAWEAPEARLEDAAAPDPKAAAGPAALRRAADAPAASAAGRKVAPGVVAYPSSDGFEILVGRSATANERLTHKLARPHDFWLHAEGPGSHVVIRNPQRQGAPSPDSLREAAALAAYFSASRAATKVNVRWTQVRHLRKPRGGAKGQVILRQAETYLASPVPPEELFARA